MDYEKAYKHALDLAKQVHDTTISKQQKENIEIIFTELTESEDGDNKRISKEITQFLKQNNGWNREWLAWLEKQSENDSNKMPIWKHWKDGIAGNGEGEPIYLTKVGNKYSLTSCLWFECDYIELSELDNLMLEKQGEQNPYSGVSISHDNGVDILFDKKLVKHISGEKQSEQKPYGQREECLDCQFNYAGECKGSCAMKRSERKPTEWSEEDEVELNGLIKHYEDGHVSTPQNRKTIKWLKSLKQRIGG